MPKFSRRSSYKKRAPLRRKRKVVRRRRSRYPSALGKVLKNRQKASFLYKDTALLTSAATSGILAQFSLSSLYDFDYSNLFTNKQPLGYDQLVQAGLYTAYLVHSWTTTITVINRGTAPVDVLYSQGPTASIVDSKSEMLNWKGTVLRSIGPADGGANKTTFTVKGRLRDIFPDYRTNSSFGAAYNSGPTSGTIGSLRIQDSVGNATAADVHVQHIFHADLSAMQTQQS